MRAVTTPALMPDLFIPEELYSAQAYLTTQTLEQIVERNLREGDAVWPGIKAVVDFEWSSTNALIIEGIDITPSLVHTTYDSTKCKAVFLVDEDGDRIREVVHTRGLWDDPHAYADDLKEKEVEWVRAYSARIRLEAEKYGYPCLEVSKSADDFAALLKTLDLKID